jgi:hypothetical protein
MIQGRSLKRIKEVFLVRAPETPCDSEKEKDPRNLSVD